MRNTLILLTCLALPAAAASAANSPPVVDAGEDQSIFLGDSAYLHGTATDPDDHIISSWQWDVDSAPVGSTYSLSDAGTPDGIFSTDTLGNYVITLIASDGLDWSDPDAVLVSVIENQPPVAVASASPLSGPAPLTVHFDGTASSDPEDDPLFYDWDFGDLTSGDGSTPTHTYQEAGTYWAALIVTDEYGNDDFDTLEIHVTPEPATLGPLALGGLVLRARRR